MSGSANSSKETEDYSDTEEEEDNFLAYIPEDQRVWCFVILQQFLTFVIEKDWAFVGKYTEPISNLQQQSKASKSIWLSLVYNM